VSNATVVESPRGEVSAATYFVSLNSDGAPIHKQAAGISR